MKQSVGVNMISPTRHKFRFSKIVRRRKSSGGNWLNKEVVVDMSHPHHSNSNSNPSPYYKGLTDQSLAISDDISSSSSCLPPPPPPPPRPTTANATAAALLLQSGYSPYYKGLTDFSLVIDSWTPHPPNNNNNPSSSTASASASASASATNTSSPYYRGLIDYSLALALHPPSPNSSSPSYSFDDLFSIDFTNTAAEKPALAPPPPISETEMVHHDDDAHVVQEDLKETESEPTLEEMELVTHGVDVEWKPLREKNESQTIQAGIGCVLQEHAEKTTLDDPVGLVNIEEEKPLRERVSEACDAAAENIVLEENAEGTGLDLEEMELVIEDEEKPLRERVSQVVDQEDNADLEEELRDCGLGGENAVSVPVPVSEQTVASELLPPCKPNDIAAEEGNLYEYLWATKYQPKNLEDFICNRDTALHLKALVKEGCGCNHFIFEGPPNGGKRSMIRAMLREIFGADRVQVVEEYKDFNLKGEMVDNLQLRIKKSLHHVEVILSEAKGYEKHVIVDLFKETYGKTINCSLPCSPENCQAIILYEAEKLSLESLLYIKWLLEKYKGCSKVFFCCSDESKLQPVRSLCTTVRLSSPSSQEIVKILEYIGKEEGIELSGESVKEIILRSKNNLRQAIRSLEATCRNKDALKDDDLILTGWEGDILKIAKNIIEEQSPRQLYAIRRKLQSLMIHDVPPDFIYKSLVAGLTSLIDVSLRSGVSQLDKEYNKAVEIKFESVKQIGCAQNRHGGSDEKYNELITKRNVMSYLKVEEFIAKFMSWYKNSCKNNNHVQPIAGT